MLLSTNNTAGTTWDSDYAFIYEFINILERIFQMFMNLFNGGSNSDSAEGAEGENADA